MRFSPSFLDEIRARIPVSDLVGRRVRLKRRGREFVGLSPFNNEKTPSFTINDQKGFYHCFSSGKHGDIFTYLTETEGLSFPEAVERLAGEAGLEMPRADPREAEREAQRATLHEVMEKAAVYFERTLQAGEGRQARDYLDRRGLSDQTIARFRLGYAPSSRHGLKDHLASDGVPHDQMVEAGLIIAGDDIPVSYDRFRDRVIFPIPDSRGRVIAFGGRALSADVPAKYLNSPDTPLFHKGGVLYNFLNARKPAHDAGTVIVVEGYMDAIALDQAGFENVVAPLGTALTERQLELVWRLSAEPVLCFDGDRAGLAAAFRAVETALPSLAAGRSLRFAFLPQGQDPDDLIRAAGPKALEGVVEGARPLIDVLWERETARPADTPEQRAGVEATLAQSLAAIRDQRVRRHYEQMVQERLDRLWDGGRMRSGGGRSRGERYQTRWRPGPRARTGQRGSAEPARSPSSSELRRHPLGRGLAGASDRREAVILLTMVNHPDLAARYAEEFAKVEFSQPDLDSLRQRIIDVITLTQTLEERVLKDQLRQQGFASLLDRMERTLTHAGDWFVRPDAAITDAEIGWTHTVARQHKALTLARELDAAETALSSDPSEDNAGRVGAARAALDALDGNEVAIAGYRGTQVEQGAGALDAWLEANRHRLP